MHKPPSPHRWNTPWRDAVPAALPPDEADAADVGTAFGLELSIAPWVDDDAAPAATAAQPSRAAHDTDEDGSDRRLREVRRFI